MSKPELFLNTQLGLWKWREWGYFSIREPVPLRKHIDTHQVETTFERGWSSQRNGELLSLAEENGFDVLVTTDQNLKYQQNLKIRRVSIVVINTTSWPRIQRSLPKIIHAIESVTMGSYVEVTVGNGS